MKLLAASIAVLALAACGRDRSAPLDDAELAPYQQCAADGDCTWSLNACRCASDGLVGVSKQQLAAFDAAFDCNPEAAKESCDTISFKPVCRTGRCAIEWRP